MGAKSAGSSDGEANRSESPAQPAPAATSFPIGESPLAVVLAATRSLCGVRTDADARLIVRDLVRDLGGRLVELDHPDALDIDVSFGGDVPLAPAAPAGSSVRDLIGEFVPGFVADATAVLTLSARIDKMSEGASIDPDTGLADRRLVVRTLSRLDPDDAVVLLTLDHLGYLSTQHGRAAADEVIRAFAAALRATARGRDVVGRYDESEFVVVLAPQQGAAALLRRLVDHWTQVRPFPITFSAGIAASGGVNSDPLGAARAALARID